MTTQTGREPEAPEPVSDVLSREDFEVTLNSLCMFGGSRAGYRARGLEAHDAALRAELAAAREENERLHAALDTFKGYTDSAGASIPADHHSAYQRLWREVDHQKARAERAEAEVERLTAFAAERLTICLDRAERAEEALAEGTRGGERLMVHHNEVHAALERYRTTYRDAAQAHHEWAADPIYGCEHCARVTAALRAISKAEGRYNRDPLIHASNTIDDMTMLAMDALASIPEATQASEGGSG